MATVNRKYFGPRALGAVVRMLLGFDRRIAEAETAVGKAVEDAEARMDEAVAAASQATTAATEIAGKAAEGEQLRAEAESGRVGAESGRVESEEERRRNEQSRLEAERSRAAGEADRIEGERVREIVREKMEITMAECSRAESERNEAETLRLDAELRRESAEALRKRAENERKVAESGRATEFESWKTEIDGKADRSELSNIEGTPTGNVIEEIEPTLVADALRKVPQTLTPEEQAQVLTNLGNPEMKTFIDRWNINCIKPEWGRYDPDNAPDPQHPFFLNDLWLTYEEALLVDRESSGANFLSRYSHTECKSRTFYPIETGRGSFNCSTEYSFAMCGNLEVLNFSDSWWVEVTNTTLYNCSKLKRIIHGHLIVIKSATIILPAIEELSFREIRADLNISASPLLSIGTMKSISDANKTSSSITVTVHPDVYAKLTDESNTEWYAVLTAAAAKNITFATI